MRALRRCGVQNAILWQHKGEMMRGVPGPKEEHVARLRRVVGRVEPFRTRAGEPFRHDGSLRPPRRGGGPGRNIERREPSRFREDRAHEAVTAHAPAALRGVVNERRSLPRKGDLFKAGDL